MGNVWDVAARTLPENPKSNRKRTVGDYVHAVVYDEPIDFHDKKGQGPEKSPRRRGAMGVDSTTVRDKNQKKTVRRRLRDREKKHPAPPEPQIRKTKGLKKKTKVVIDLTDQTEEEKAERRSREEAASSAPASGEAEDEDEDPPESGPRDRG
mgnify:CR=1 FL=1